MPNLLDLAYFVLLLAASPWLVYQALARGKYQQGLWTRLTGNVPVAPSSQPTVWLHAVSLGEVNLLAPLVSELRRRRPDWRLVISSTTLTGYTQARSRYAGLEVFYCPLDFTWAVRRAFDRVQPSLLVLAELELWPNLIRQARRRGTRVAIVNGRLSERSFRGYRRLERWLRPLMAELDLVAVQDAAHAGRFAALGASAESTIVTGSLKFDGALRSAQAPEVVERARLAGYEPGDVVFFAGSTQAPEEELAIAAYRTLAERFPRLRLVLCPRHPHRFDEVATLLDASGLAWRRRSQLASPQAVGDSRILLIDTVGELAAWWGVAQIAFVGGSLSSRGGQNMLEPAGYGAAISFGPNTRNFRDIVAALLDRDAAVVVQNGDELRQFVERCLTEPDWASKLGQRAQQLVAQQVGATAATVELLLPLVATARPSVARAA